MLMRQNLIKLLFLNAMVTLSFPVFAANFKVEEQRIDDRKAVLATVQTQDLTPARARIGGTISQLLIDEGARVEQGAVIATVVDEKLNLELQALLERMASMQAEKKLAQIALDRAQKLRQSGAGSQARLDEARTQLDVVNRNLNAMESERELIRQREREGAVLSPAAGTVTQVGVSEGMVILPGEPIGQIAEENFILRLEVPERHARFIKVDDKVFLEEASDEGETNLKTGQVQLVYPEMINGRVRADVAMTGLEDKFIGERVRVFVTTGTRKTFFVPKDYIHNRFGLNFVTHENGIQTVIQAGSMVGEQVEVLSGLRDGDMLILPKDKMGGQ